MIFVGNVANDVFFIAELEGDTFYYGNVLDKLWAVELTKLFVAMVLMFKYDVSISQELLLHELNKIPFSIFFPIYPILKQMN